MSDTIRSIGAQMATMMYNLSQGANLPAETRDLMLDMHQRWDAAVSADKAPPPQPHVMGSENFNPAHGSNATADQMSAVMLLTGTDAQKREALGLPAAHVMGVKPLEWSRVPKDDYDDPETYRAYSPVHRYFSVHSYDGVWFHDRTSFATREEAQAAAQAEFDTLIRAAIAPASTVNNPATLEKSDFQKFDVEGERQENKQETPKQHVVGMPNEPTPDMIRLLFTLNSATPRSTDEVKQVYSHLLNFASAEVEG